MNKDAIKQLAEKLADDLTNTIDGVNKPGVFYDVDEAARLITIALADVERAQMERDCAAVCGCCKAGEELQRDDEWHHLEWHHLFRGHLRNVCRATDIRDAFAALHPESAP